MPLSQDDYLSLLHLVRRRVAESNLLRYEESAVMSALEAAQPSQQLLAYLDRLTQLAAAASGEQRERIISSLRESISTRDGEEISAIQIELTDAQAAIYGTRVIGLPDDPGLRSLANDLAAIRDDLAREIEPPTPQRNPRAR